MQDQKSILVTGGAGYIGSHVVRQLGEAGYKIVVYDNLSTGFAEAVLHGTLIRGDLNDTRKLSDVFAKYQFDSVLHFAASLVVPESVKNPLKYYENNTKNTLNLLHCCSNFGVRKFVFSSTAAVYGEPAVNPVTEAEPTQPINPYGRSKLMSEWMIQDWAATSNFRFVILRYFNVAGAEPNGLLGQRTEKAEHLIRMACDAAQGKRPSLAIFGSDYPTEDGTAIRDYIHVEDLASAHVSALRYLEQGGQSETMNCGYGNGYSVKQVGEKVQKISGINFPIIKSEPRAGDPACVIANVDRIQAVLDWQPQHNSLDEIIESSLNWEKKYRNSEKSEASSPDKKATA